MREYLGGIREEEDSKDRVVNDSTDIVPVPVGDGSDSFFRVDLFRRKVQGRATGSVETDSAGDRIQTYNGVTQAP